MEPSEAYDRLGYATTIAARRALGNGLSREEVGRTLMELAYAIRTEDVAEDMSPLENIEGHLPSVEEILGPPAEILQERAHGKGAKASGNPARMSPEELDHQYHVVGARVVAGCSWCDRQVAQNTGRLQRRIQDAKQRRS